LETKVWRIIDIINWSKEYFEKHSIDSPRLTIELMLVATLGINRVNLYTNFDKPLNDLELSRIREMVNLRAKRVPLQYIIGSVDFYGERFVVNQDVLIPRPETEELVDLVIKECDRTRNIRILDIGTGSGCIAISLAKHLPNAEVTALDSSPAALTVAKQNAKNISVTNINFVNADILKMQPQLRYDIIVSNPPYISTQEMLEIEPELNHEPKIALTDNSDGLEFYRRFVTIFKDALSYDSRFYLELNSTLSSKVEEMFIKDYSVTIVEDIFGNQRILCGTLMNK
jgi:release factor glutamine methyltransferase